MKNFIGVHKTEEEQEDQIKNWWKENGIQIIGGVVIGMLAYGAGIIIKTTYMLNQSKREIYI